MSETQLQAEQRSIFISNTPLIPAGVALDEALRFYTEKLGFTVEWQGGSMAGVRRDGVAFNLVENSNKEWADNCSCSIGVTDLDALYAEYSGLASELRMTPVRMQPWGRREFHMIVPSGVCLQFFEQG